MTQYTFFAEDSSLPPVRMYDFFRMLTLSDVNISLTEFQEIYYKYCSMLDVVDKVSPIPIRELKKGQFTRIEPALSEIAKKIYDKLKGNPYFDYLLMETYEKYIKKPLVNSVKRCLSASKIRGVLSAYKLFYVDCSRAKKSLTVVVDKEKIVDYEAVIRGRDIRQYDKQNNG